MNSKSRTNGHRRAGRTTWLALAIVAGAMIALYGTATAKKGDSAHSGRYVSHSVEVPGSRSETLVKVPVNKQLMITQTCQENPAMYVEIGEFDGDRISFNGNGCTHFEPGYLVDGGESVVCVNKSAQARSCVLMGMLRDNPKASPGARFYDVDDELKKK